MSTHAYGHLEITGSSAVGSDDAIKNAVAKAEEKVGNVRWFEVVGTRGHLENGAIAHWQVTIKVGYQMT